jgi:pyrimidine-nucleoside phosphorylase
LHKKVGDKIEKEEPILTIHSNTEDISHIKEKLYDAIHISTDSKDPITLIYETIAK